MLNASCTLKKNFHKDYMKNVESSILKPNSMREKKFINSKR